MMKKKLTIILGLIIIAAGAAYFASASGLNLFGGNAYQDDNDGLILDLSLSQNNYNSSTKVFSDNAIGNNGVSANAANFVPDNYGKSTGAMSFNGTTDYINQGNSSIYNLQAGATVSIWVKIPSTWSGNTYPNLVSKGASAGWDTDGWGIYAFSSNVIGIGMRNGGSVLSRSFPNTVKDQWTHIVATWNGTTVTLYQDGIYKTSGAQTIVPAVNATNVIIGRGPVSQYFGGSIGAVKIYNRALSASEVKALYNSSKPKLTVGSTQTGLVAYWPLDGANFDATSNRVSDKTPYENNGTNYGATLTTDRNGKADGAMSFDGSNRISTNFTNQLTDFTVALWFKDDGNIRAYERLADKNFTNCFWLGRNSSVANSWGGGIKQASAPYGVFVTLPDGQWNHIVIMRQGTTETIIGNGGQVISTLTVPATACDNSNFGIGAWGNGTSPAQWGMAAISDVRIYNRALSLDEVSALYNSNRPKVVSDSLQKGLLGYWPLDSDNYSATTGKVADKTPYENSGINYGANFTEDATTLSADNLENLTLNYRVWKDGQTGSIGTFALYGAANSRVIAADPWGREVPVWKSGITGGIYNSAIPIDNTKLYRMSWWEKRVTNAGATSARYYAGLNGYGSVSGVINLAAGTYNTNPYFWSTNTVPSEAQLPVGQWVLVVAHVFPYTYTGTTRHPDSGVYKTSGFFANTTVDFKWAPETTTARGRTLAVYQGNDANIVHYTVYPRFDVVDGTEPSVQDLLNGYDSYGNNIKITVPGNKVSYSFWYAEGTSSDWVYVANSNGTFYVNGQPGTPAKYPIAVSGDNVYVGRTTMSDYFLGSISSLRIYDRALSAAEVQSLYDKGR
ncbi:MAG: LamG domain-containing protein [Patescibacteria group bacterium]